ncbi:thermostable hemolysin [Marinomonas ostreistagni]|uniref:thermostable hemolysin n=1 Tax=Marinomonas ostreistagni TaxID=359209 RepID=UPI0019521A6E|nr:thermostable hemolysin [Marinomonas ostreistagni]MBM6549519.1 thermostable hemolysin [Marinomonas ostreistagni]
MQQSPVVTLPAIKANRLKGPTQAFEFVMAQENSSARDTLEQFIHSGFARCYDANVETYLPLLLGIKSKQLRAAVGVRRATSPLFIEQYLSHDINAVLAKHGVHCERHQIAEMGNLYSLSHRFTLPLIMTVVIGLYLTNVRQLIFAGTQKVRDLLSHLGFSMVYLGEASAQKLVTQASEWGTYYQHQPQVMALDIEDSIKVAFQQSLLHDVLALAQSHAQTLLPQLRSL